MQLFKGKFYVCSDPDVTSRDECTGTFSDGEGSEGLQRAWERGEWG
eukprot:COSAG05_NODE_2827_length_2594_cov_36.512811_1_plen_45_part_10